MRTPADKCALIKEKMKEVLEILGLDLEAPSLKETPERIAKMYVYELFDGLDVTAFPKVTLQRQEGASRQTIHVKNIQVTSYCEHHFVPMVGYAHVAYIPADDQVVGFSSIHRIVRYYAHRPQLQERLTWDIANGLMGALKTENLAITLQLRHFCVVARGVEDVASETTTELRYGLL